MFCVYLIKERFWWNLKGTGYHPRIFVVQKHPEYIVGLIKSIGLITLITKCVDTAQSSSLQVQPDDKYYI